MPPGDFKNMFDFQAMWGFSSVENANMTHWMEAFSNMAAAHNMFVQGVNAIVHHGPTVTPDKVQPFMLFCVTLVRRAVLFFNLSHS